MGNNGDEVGVGESVIGAGGELFVVSFMPVASP